MTPISRILRASEWKYAFGEVLLLVVGISIALAIDEWRGNIENIRTEREYIDQLVDDLRLTEERMASVIEINASAESANSRLLTVFENGENIEPDTLRQLIGESWVYDNPVPVFATTDALVTTGDLRLIRDSTVRSRIARYLSNTRDYWLVPLYSIETEHRAQYARVAKLAAANGVLPTRPSVVGQKHHAPNVGAFLADADAYAEIQLLLRNKETFRRYRVDMADEAATLRQLIEEYVHSEWLLKQ